MGFHSASTKEIAVMIQEKERIWYRLINFSKEKNPGFGHFLQGTRRRVSEGKEIRRAGKENQVQFKSKVKGE